MREMEKFSTFSLRSTEIGWSSSDGPRFKVGVLNEGYAWLPETPSFSKVSHGRFEESKASGLGSVREMLRLFRMLKLFPRVGNKVFKHYITVGVHRSFAQGVVS